MSIYLSTKVMPYVYMGIHKITGEIYIGYREKNVRLGQVSSEDLPIYRTSSKVVKPNFDEYDWYILAEFYNSNDAYDFEQQLIYENWDNPLLLNKRCNHDKTRFKASDLGKLRSDETKKKMSAAGKGKLSPRKGMPGIPHSVETKQKLSIIGRGKFRSDETKQKMAAAWVLRKQNYMKPESDREEE